MRRIGVLLLAIGLLFGRETFGATELMVNGGFETPTAPWQFQGNFTGISFSSNPTFAHTGNNFLSMGNVNGTQFQRVFQVVTIPTNTILAEYSYFCSGVSTDPANTSELLAFVVTTNGSATLTNALHVDLNGNFSYLQRTTDLTVFAGRTIGIAFETDFANSTNGAGSTFRVDDVSLISYTASDIPANDNFANATLITTNTTLLATNVVASSETGEPKHAGKIGGHSVWWKWVAPGNGEMAITTAGSTFNTLLAVYTGTSLNGLKQVAANDDVNTSGGGFTSRVKFLVSAGTEYEIAVDGKNGDTGIAHLNWAFSADTKDPNVTITSPKSGAKLTNSTVVVQGTASDDLAVALVQFRLENADGTNDYQDADGTNTWSATINGLIPGPNTIRVRAFDTSSNESASVASTVSFVVVSPLIVSISGTGTVTPNLSNTLQNVGVTLTMTAKPGVGQVFASWSGDINANTAALTFVMRSNMVLQANFAPNPFIPVAGTYQGLFYDNHGPTHESSGFLTATLSTGGALSARITLAGKSYSLSGQFSADGSFSNNIVRKGLTPVSAQLQLDLAGGGITGLLSDGTWTAQLAANRAQTSPGAAAGKYTLVLPGGFDGVAQPGGDGYGTLTVSTAGAISLKGALADGSKVTQKANLLTTGQWPFYASLYSGNGSIFGWLTFSNGFIGGRVNWFKKAQPTGKIYQGGFTNFSDAAGSVYSFTSGVPVLDFSTGQFSLSNGNLAASLVNEIALDSASKITSTNATLKISISTATGSFRGSVGNPTGGKAISFAGVVLQKQNVGGGFFTGTNQTGRAHLGPDPGM
jgi:Big-like domain-containing protein/List-Bact-rpt repeat protein